MTDQELQRRLNQFVRLGNELHAEARRRYGDQAHVFHEAGGGVHIMDGDDQASSTRQRHIKYSADIMARWGLGCW